MSYFSIRAILLIIIVVIYKKYNNNNLSHSLLLAVCLSIIFIPFESKITKFKTVESAFNYSFPKAHIFKKIDIGDGYIIIYDKRINEVGIVYIECKSYFNFIYPFANSMSKTIYNDVYIYKKEIPNNKTVIYIEYNNSKIVEISDTFNTEFNEIKFDNKNDGMIRNIAIIDNHMTNYSLNINDENIEI